MAFTFPTSPEAGDTFKHGGLEFVYRASRWAFNGYNGIPDPFAGYTQGTFTATSGLLSRTVARGSTAFPPRPNTPCLLYTSPSPRDRQKSRMPSSA